MVLSDCLQHRACGLDGGGGLGRPPAQPRRNRGDGARQRRALALQARTGGKLLHPDEDRGGVPLPVQYPNTVGIQLVVGRGDVRIGAPHHVMRLVPVILGARLAGPENPAVDVALIPATATVAFHVLLPLFSLSYCWLVLRFTALRFAGNLLTVCSDFPADLLLV